MSGRHAIYEDQVHTGQRQGRKNSVEQGDARELDGQTIDGDEPSGEHSNQGRAGKAASNEHHQPDNDKPGNSHREAPAQRVGGAKQCHAQPNEPLAEWRMHHVRRVGIKDVGITGSKRVVGSVGPRCLVATVKQGPRILHIKRLVKHQRVWIGDVPEAQNGGQQQHQQRATPEPEALSTGRAQHAHPPVVESRAGAIGRQVERGVCSHGRKPSEANAESTVRMWCRLAD